MLDALSVIFPSLRQNTSYRPTRGMGEGDSLPLTVPLVASESLVPRRIRVPESDERPTKVTQASSNLIYESCEWGQKAPSGC